MSIAGSLHNLFTRALIVRSFPSSALTRLPCSLAHRDEVSEIIRGDRGACHASDRARPDRFTHPGLKSRVVLLKPLITSPLIEVGEV
jgi:hypothetical protein